MRQQTLEECFYDQKIIKAVRSLLGSGSYAVAKPVRAGFTTSAILAAHQAGIPILYLAPTNAIIDDTVKKVAAMDNSVKVPANIECRILQEKVKAYPLLKYLPSALPDCSTCPHKTGCTVLAILNMDHPGLICMTYSKLAALMHSNSYTARDILTKLSRQAVIILDEAHILSKPAQIAVEAGRRIVIPPGYPTLENIYNKWLNFNDRYAQEIQDLLDKSDNFAGKYLATPIPKGLTIRVSDDKPEAWRELREIACSENMNQDDLMGLLNIVNIMDTDYITLQFQHDSDTGRKYVMVTSGRSEMVASIKDFLQDYGAKADHIYVSGTLYEPHPGFFNELSGREVKPIVFPDFQHANGTITLVVDKWKLSSWNFKDKLPVIMDTIEAIVELWQVPILLFAPNKAKAALIKQEIQKRGIKNVKVDYYRSSISMGVESKYRVCIAVGMAETPSNSCDSMAVGEDEGAMWLDSGCIRLQGVHADTWQAINRVKDPAGKVPSIVYMVGCRAEQVKLLTRWGNNRQVVVTGIEDKRSSQGEDYKVRLYDVKADDLIEPPPITGEDQDVIHSERRNLQDYIGGIEGYYNNEEINSENHSISSIHISRENGVKLGIYNNPIDKNQLDSTIESLSMLFVNREDAFGRQYKVEGGASWTKVVGSLSADRLKEHVQGKKTYGSYQLGLDDTVIWSCIDIDSHKGNRPITDEVIEQTRADVKKVIDVLRRYGVPFLLEASGSPGSYHIWIFHPRTKTYNSHRFIKQVAAESGIKGYELFPKQKTLGKNDKYGNLVKVPVCINQKCDGRSVFIDPETFAPIDGVIEHPGLVRLLEVPQPGKRGKEALKMPRKVYRKHQERGEFDPCMYAVMHGKVPLEGSEGHEMRIAIVIKAIQQGMTDEQVAMLFADQPDFNYEISLEKVKEIRRYGYKPYSCSTLKDKCGEVVAPHCKKCVWRR